MEEREFYITVAELLGCDDHVYRSWPYLPPDPVEQSQQW